MNKFEIRKMSSDKNIDDYDIFIDGKVFYQILNERKYVSLSENNLETFDNLCFAWTKGLDFWGDVRFVWNLINRKKAIVPILMCPDDLDFSCIVLVVEVEKTENSVIWKRAGYVCEEDYNLDDEKQKGILDTEHYSDRDWEKYGDNIALAKVDSDEWRQWIADNWDEEVFRRLMNYTLPKYEIDGNIIWFADLDFEFESYQYEMVIDEYWKQQTLFELNCYTYRPMTFTDCVKIIKKLTRDGEEKLDEHLMDFGEVLLHIYASDEVGNQLFDLLQKNEDVLLIEIYCKVIELMWKYGTDEVVNVVDVTLLERLSDDVTVWNRLGEHISAEFKEYINNDLLRTNVAMCGVLPMK